MLKTLYRGIFYISVLSIGFLATTSTQIKVVENTWDKANHFMAFFVLYLLVSLAYEYLSIKTKVLLLMIFAIQIEVVQYFIPARCFSGLDVLADGIGVLLGIGAYSLYARGFKVTSS